MRDDFEKVFGDKKRVMVVFAHPDDAEVMAGGTIARLVASGKRVRVVKMTSGDRGSRQEKYEEKELSSLREQEDTASMNVLGIKPEDNVYIRIRDGEIEDSIEVIEKIAYQIREFQPDLIITHNPENVAIRFDKDTHWINHRDHRATGQATLDAAYPYSRDLLFFPEHFKNKDLKSHSVSQFLLVDFYGHPDEVQFDVADFIEKRIEAHECHKSQYTKEGVKDSADFFTLTPEGHRRERFRYVFAD